jgi:predicted nuclease of restriction endonuclease-like (RecB) superfamily
MSKITKKSATVSRKSVTSKASGALAPILPPAVAELANGSELKNYSLLFKEVSSLLEASRRAAARSVNAIMTATYWEIGRRIVEHEQGGKARAEYGEALMARLARDLVAEFGRGFSYQNLNRFRQFYLAFPSAEILSTPSRELESSIPQALSAESSLARAATRFPLPWSAYVSLLGVKNEHTRQFYEAEALRGGWSVRQLDRQIDSQFYERTALSKNKAAMLTKGAAAKPEAIVTPEQAIKDPFVLEFLNLKDEYSETNLEEGLIRHLETFLMELGSDFAFIGRQKRLRIGDEWYRVDLLFFHRRLKCLVIVDLKLGKFTHADAGQMHMYLNYAREHWTHPDENPPVGLILCAQKNEALAHYALEGLPNKVMATEYKTALPEEKLIADELDRTRRLLEERKAIRK